MTKEQEHDHTRVSVNEVLVHAHNVTLRIAKLGSEYMLSPFELTQVLKELGFIFIKAQDDSYTQEQKLKDKIYVKDYYTACFLNWCFDEEKKQQT
jgi:hypothetical protein